VVTPSVEGRLDARRPGGRHEVGRQSGAAPQHPPTQTAAGDVDHPDVTEVAAVTAGGPDVGDKLPDGRRRGSTRFPDPLRPSDYAGERESGP
jgi:hypothetical protein